MRVADAPPAPALLIIDFITTPSTPPSLRGGLSASATRISPFGSTSIERGWSSPSAKRATFSPCAARGASPAGQRVASGTFIVGMVCAFCDAITGTRPLSSAVEKRATSGRESTYNMIPPTTIRTARAMAAYFRILRMGSVLHGDGTTAKGRLAPPDG